MLSQENQVSTDDIDDRAIPLYDRKCLVVV